METPKISVCIPVYNAEKFLPSTLDSVLNQTFKDFELILVDDGSTDSCGAICDAYAKKDPRIRVIHKQNEGIVKTGIRLCREARSEWVCFMDDDDTLEPEALESMYKLTDGTDLVAWTSKPEGSLLPKNATIEDYRVGQLTGKIRTSGSGRLVRKSIYTDDLFDFPRELQGETDMISNTRLSFKLTRLPHILYKPIYNHRRNPTSISHFKEVSLQHERLFYKYFIGSIPESERPKYMQHIVMLKLNGLFPVAYRDPASLLTAEGEEYLAEIRENVRSSGYKLHLKERMILGCRVAPLLKLTGFLELAHRSLGFKLWRIKQKFRTSHQ